MSRPTFLSHWTNHWHLLIHTQYSLSRHVLSHTVYLFPSIHQKNCPSCNTWRVSTAWLRFQHHPDRTVPTRNCTRPADVCLQPCPRPCAILTLPACFVSHCLPLYFNLSKRIVQGEISGESQRHSYASSTAQIEPYQQGTARGQPMFVLNHILFHTQYSLFRHVFSLSLYLFPSIHKNRPR